MPEIAFTRLVTSCVSPPPTCTVLDQYVTIMLPDLLVDQSAQDPAASHARHISSSSGPMKASRDGAQMRSMWDRDEDERRSNPGKSELCPPDSKNWWSFVPFCPPASVQRKGVGGGGLERAVSVNT